MTINKIVLVFKTDVSNTVRSRLIIRSLMRQLPETKINFDLDDTDHVLRIEKGGQDLGIDHVMDVILLLNKYGHQCEVLA